VNRYQRDAHTDALERGRPRRGDADKCSPELLRLQTFRLRNARTIGISGQPPSCQVLGEPARRALTPGRGWLSP